MFSSGAIIIVKLFEVGEILMNRYKASADWNHPPPADLSLVALKAVQLGLLNKYPDAEPSRMAGSHGTELGTAGIAPLASQSSKSPFLHFTTTPTHSKEAFDIPATGRLLDADRVCVRSG